MKIRTLAPFVQSAMVNSIAAVIPDFQPLTPLSSLSTSEVLSKMITVVDVERQKEGPGIRRYRGRMERTCYLIGSTSTEDGKSHRNLIPGEELGPALKELTVQER